MTGWNLVRWGMGASVLGAFLLLSAPAGADVDGKAVYDKSCASCHGPDGKGETPVGRALKVVDLITKRWASPDAIPDIEKTVREGVPRMPAMGAKLKPEEIAAVARFTQQMAAAANPQQ
jgi:mono/diheme cytochrome c family protein